MHGSIGKTIVIIFMFIVQLSCCIGYLYFVALILETIICDKAEFCGYKTYYKLAMIIPTIPLCLLKTYTNISYVSIAGITCAMTGGLILIGYLCDILVNKEEPKGEIKIFDYVQFFGYVGIAMFSFEGNGVVINIKAVARDKKRYPNILRLAVLSIIIWYMILATISYITYKDETGKVDYIT